MIIKGMVKTGKGEGRRLGFPTANLHVTCNMKHETCKESRRKVGTLSMLHATCYMLHVKAGVYQAYITIKGRRRVAAAIVGMWQEAHGPSLEVHVLNFSGDLTGQEVTVELGKFLRPLKKFNNDEELIEQIKQDLEYIARST